MKKAVVKRVAPGCLLLSARGLLFVDARRGWYHCQLFEVTKL